MRHRDSLLLLILTLAVGCGQRAAPTDGVTDGATPDDMAAAAAAVVPALERLSGLDRVDVLRMRRQSREDARSYVADRLEVEMPAAVREGVRRTYVAAGLLPDTLDLERLLLDLYTEQVLGYYDPATTTLYVIDDAEPESLRPVIVHELVHALQDQHVDLDSIIATERGNDRQTAAHAAMEGHAMLVMFAYLAEQATGDVVDPASLPSPATELGPALTAQNEQFPVFGRAPAIIRETILFPYLRGADFVHQLWASKRPMDRYPAPIDSLMPQSTEQVLRPVDRFITERDAPVDLSLGDDDGADDVVIIHEDTFGQLETGIYLNEHLGEGAAASADGWDGDRFRLIEHEGHDVLQWASVWETPANADRFAAAVRRAAIQRTDRKVAVLRLDVDGRAGVLVTDAPATAPTAATPAIRAVSTP